MTKSFAVMALIAVTLLISAVAQASVGYDFAADTQGWAAESWDGYGTPTLSWTSFHGGALQADTSSMTVPASPGNWAKTYLKGDLSSAADLTSTPIYSLDIWVPDNMYVTAKLGVKTGGIWTLYQGSETSELTRNAWQTLSWDMTGTTGLNDVRQLGVEIRGWYPTPTGNTFNIDNAAANAAPIPEPASLLLLGTGLAGIFGLKIRKARG